MLMTFVCFGIAKLECQMLNIIGCFFFISYMPMHDLLKKKICKENKKQKESKYYRMYLEGDSPHQIVMIVCELK